MPGGLEKYNHFQLSRKFAIESFPELILSEKQSFGLLYLHSSYLNTSKRLQVIHSDEGDEDSDVLRKPGSGA